MIYQSKTRNPFGQSSALMVILAVFVVGVLGMFVFEVAHMVLGHQQLKACLDSAALAGACSSASSNISSSLSTQQNAMATALNMFNQNSILGQSLSSATQASSLPLTPAANQAQLYFQFLDPTTLQPVALGSENGKIIQVFGAFGLVPYFAQYVGLGSSYVIQDTSSGGLPKIDLILCFDISASMDDFTNVSVVNRYWGGKYNAYYVINNGPLYNAFKATDPLGTAVNATFPQQLDASPYGNEGIYTFSPTYRGTNNGARALYGKTGYVTDVVVNLDGTTNESSGTTVTYNGAVYDFPAGNAGVGVLVEASRGNLESIKDATKAGVDLKTLGVTPKAGYFQAYLQTALGQRHPIYDGIVAAQSFFSILKNNADVHFGLVTFSTVAGTSATSTVPPNGGTLGNIACFDSTYASNAFPSDPCPQPPNPGISLNPATGSDNYNTVDNAIAPVVALGGTNISGALGAALNQMLPKSQGGQGLSRPGAAKAIVLFTDGLPTEPTNVDPTAAARHEAAVANAAGIPIHCIGLCLTPGLQATQTAVLTDTNSDPSTGGIAGISGNGAIFYQTTTSAGLNQVFQNLARNLCQLVKG